MQYSNFSAMFSIQGTGTTSVVLKHAGSCAKYVCVWESHPFHTRYCHYTVHDEIAFLPDS